jgi:hypothetical protein
MDSTTYREQTSRADAFRRVTLTDTAIALESTDTDLALRVRTLLEQSSIPKPEGHNDGPDTDIFQVELPLATVDAIVEALGTAEAGAVATDGTTTREASHFATLLDTWNRYRFLLHENHAA